MHEPAQFHAPHFQHTPGERIGKYVLDRPLGCGGFAEVWAALDSGANRTVALKIFSDRVTRDPAAWRAIREEPKKQPEHERIVPIYYCHLDSEDGYGPFYVVMKFMPGGTLDELLRQRGRLPAAEAVAIIKDVLAGLDYAHGRGIVHRDIKPTNILFDGNGRAALADFGIAKDLNKSGQNTVFGAVVGTAAYMSPEQGEGQRVTKASDIYSMGTVLYESLAGKLPYDGPSETAIIIARSRQDPPPLRTIVPDISQQLETVVQTSLDRNLAVRYADCASFHRALESALEPPRVAPPPLPTPSPKTHVQPAMPVAAIAPQSARRSKVFVVAAAALAIAAGLGLYLKFDAGTVSSEQGKIDWKRVRYDDLRLSHCAGSEECLERKTHADELRSADWSAMQPGNSLLTDCMGYPACEERRQMPSAARRKPVQRAIADQPPRNSPVKKRARTPDDDDFPARRHKDEPNIYDQSKHPD